MNNDTDTGGGPAKPPALGPLEKKGFKFTLLRPGNPCGDLGTGLGKGAALTDERHDVVSRGWVYTAGGGRTIGFAEPRKRSMKDLLHALRLPHRGAILLRDHHDYAVFTSDVKHSAGSGARWRTTSLFDGGRFVDAAGDGGGALLDFLKGNLLLHTMRPGLHRLRLFSASADDRRGSVDLACGDFPRRLLEALGPAADFGVDEPEPVPPPARKNLLTDEMKERLRARCGDETPEVLYKIFQPDGAATWLLCSLMGDGDTLWAVCDIGAGVVEFGTVSLASLESSRGSCGMPPEVDKFFDPAGLDVGLLIQQDSLCQRKH